MQKKQYSFPCSAWQKKFIIQGATAGLSSSGKPKKIRTAGQAGSGVLFCFIIFLTTTIDNASAQSFHKDGVEYNAQRTVTIPAGKTYSVVVTEFLHHAVGFSSGDGYRPLWDCIHAIFVETLGGALWILSSFQK